MAGARKDRRSRGSGDSGDTPSGERAGNDGAGTVASGTDWETPEVLAAMNDTDFASAVHRAVASHRKIFVNQERNWAAVRLRANLMPARVAAERARQGLGASGRARARSKPVRLKPVRAGDARDERVGDVAHRGEMASVVVKRFAKKGASAETRQAAPLEALPRADNVPRYTSYQYCADTNGRMHDQVPLKLLYADQEGEMRAASDDEEGEESSESDEEEPETKATTTTSEKSFPGSARRERPNPGQDVKTAKTPRLSQEPKKPKMTAAMRAAEKRREAEEAAAEVAAAKDWEPRDDYTLFALATTLGETSRVLDAVAETIFSHSATTLRARLKRLKGEGDEKGDMENAEKIDAKAKRSSSSETLAETYARALEAVRSGVTANAEYRAAAAHVAARARRQKNSGGAPAEAPAALASVLKHDPEYSDADLDDGRDAPGTGTGTGTGRPSNLSVVRKHAASAAARERVATWSLTAWRFLVRSGDAPALLLPDADPNATTSEVKQNEAPARQKNQVLFDDKGIDEGLDSFKSLFCVRCHVYDCDVHGCGQPEHLATRGYETPAVERGPGGRPKAPKEREDGERETDADGIDGIASVAKKNDGETRAPPPCASRSCWRLIRGAAEPDPSFLGTSERDASGSPARVDGVSPSGSTPLDRVAPDGTNVPAFDPERARRETDAYVKAQAALPDAYARWSSATRAWYDGFFDDASAALNDGVEWSTFETSLYERLRRAFSVSSPRTRVDPCALARAVGGPTCASVAARLTRDARVERVEAARAEARDKAMEETEEEGDGKKMKKKQTGGWPRGKKRKSPFGANANKAKKKGTRAIPTTVYRPCDCCANASSLEPSRKNACGVDGNVCACASVGNFCERWCGCGGSCANFHGGCNCKQGACNTRACPCFAADRECDPDVCKRCAHTAESFEHARRDGWPFSALCAPVPAAPAAPTAFSFARAKPDERCGNMRVLLSQRKHVQLGLSTVAGWGAFLRDGAARNELIGEYTGELISQREADRRGKIYDKQYNLSFLFNLNDQFVLDAHSRGNKLKFANHSSTPNCFVRVLMVRGDHRIGIFALRDIVPGEELFFDYCYERDKAPDWVEFDDASGSEASKKKKHAPGKGHVMKARG